MNYERILGINKKKRPCGEIDTKYHSHYPGVKAVLLHRIANFFTSQALILLRELFLKHLDFLGIEISRSKNW